MIETRRVNINLPVDLLERVDAWGEKNGVNRTSAIRILCSQSLDQQQALLDINRLMDMIKEQQTL